MKWILLLTFIATSCNVTKVLTDGETKVPDEFFDQGNGGCSGTSCNESSNVSDGLMAF